MKSIVIGLFVGVCLTGCSLVSPKLAPKAAAVVERYCAEPYAARLVLRNEVNAMVDPNSVKITCFGDPE